MVIDKAQTVCMNYIPGSRSSPDEAERPQLEPDSYTLKFQDELDQ